MKNNKSKFILVIAFIAVAVLVMFFIKNKPVMPINNENSAKQTEIDGNVKEDSSSNSEDTNSSDLNNFKEAYKEVDKEDVLFAGKDAGFEKFL